MKARLVSVGKPKDRALSLLHDRYAERLAPLGLRYESIWVPEVRATARFTEEHRREREAHAVLERVAGAGVLVALDPAGHQLTSEKLSERIARWSTPRVTFVLGGPLGLHGQLLDASSWVWSLSALTFPHELARVMVVEQIYRALTLLKGVPYHK